jgi:proline iminopeptidase
VDGLTTADGRRLAYRRVGEGPALVCHGGGPGFSAFYFGELAGLGEKLELILLDPRGTGASDRPTDARAYAIEDYADDVEELREHLGLERINLLGHSHGGVVAMDYAARYPDRVEKLILASTLARFAQEQVAAMEAAMAAKADEPWFEDASAALVAEQKGEFETDEELGELAIREFPFYFADYGDAERAYLESLRDDVPNADTLRYFNQEIFETFDLRPQLGRIKAPALVIAGEQDFITGPVCADEIAAGLTDARKVLIPGAGHFVFVETPDEFRAAVLEFIGA